MRTVSIAGHKEDLVTLLQRLQQGVEREGVAEVGVTANGTRDPDLGLRFTVESDPEFTEPVVDYFEGD